MIFQNQINFRLFSIIYFAFLSNLAAQTSPAPEMDTLHARQLLQQHEAALEQGAYQQALSLVEKASQLYEQHQQWETVIDCYITLSMVSDQLSVATKAHYAGEAHRLATKHLSIYHPLLGKAFRQRAEVYTAQERFDSSNHYLALAIPIFSRAKLPNEQAWCEIMQAVNYYYQGNYEASKEILLEKVKPLTTQQGVEEEVQTTLYDLLEVIYYVQGDIDRETGSFSISSINFFLQ